MPESIEGLSSTIRLEVDSGMKARWEQSRTKIVDAQRGGAESFTALWKSVADVIEASPPLYLAAGFATTKAFVEKFLKVPMRNATRNLQVVRFASRTEIERYGVHKIEAALGLLSEEHSSLDKLRVPIERKGKASKATLDEASVEEIKVAVRDLRPKKPGPLKGRNTTAALLTRALTEAKIKGVSVVVGKSGITFRGVQLDTLHSFVHTLSLIKLPRTELALRSVA